MFEPMTYDWQQLATTWQALPVDELRLRRATRWKTWRMAANAALEVLVIFYVWGITWWLFDSLSEDPVLRSWLLFWCAATPLCVAWSFWNKRGLWRVADTTTLAMLQLQKLRAEAGVRYARFSIHGMVFSIVLTLLFGAWANGLDASASWRQWLPFVMTTVWLMLGIGLTAWYRRRQQRKRSEVSELLKEFDSRAG